MKSKVQAQALAFPPIYRAYLHRYKDMLGQRQKKQSFTTSGFPKI